MLRHTMLGFHGRRLTHGAQDITAACLSKLFERHFETGSMRVPRFVVGPDRSDRNDCDQAASGSRQEHQYRRSEEDQRSLPLFG